MMIAVAAAVLAVNAARTVLRHARPAPPAVVARVDWIAPEYLDRAAIDEQLVDPPRLVRTVLWPALGSPARADPARDLDIILDRPHPGAEFALLSRERLPDLDRDLYALPPPPSGAARAGAAR